MPSDLHEEIIDDIRFGVVNWAADKYPSEYIDDCIMVLIDWSLFHVLYCGGENFPLKPDLIIDLIDKHGPIMVEVGNMQDGKWSHVTAHDGERVRVLRVGFDRSVALLNQRNTKRERALIKFMTKELFSPEATL